MSLGSVVVGIDVGTITTYVSVAREGGVVAVPSAGGQVGFPTLVVFDGDAWLAGEAAAAYSGGEPRIFGFKPMGGDCAANFRGAARRFQASEVMAVILAEAKRDAERFVGEPIRGAVLAVPNHFTSEQRRSLRKAAAIANLHVVRLLNDTTALMLASASEGCLVAMDLGYSSLQVAVGAKGGNALCVLAQGSSELGGQCLTMRLAAHVASLPAAVSADPAMLESACEKAKCGLGFEPTVPLPPLGDGEMEDICRVEFQGMAALLRGVVERSKRTGFDGVILAGQSGRLEPFRRLVRDMFPGGVVSQPSVAHGAALLAEGRFSSVREVANATHFAVVDGEEPQPVVFRGEGLPAHGSMSFSVPFGAPVTISYGEGFRVTACRAINFGGAGSEASVRLTLGIDGDGICEPQYAVQGPAMLLPAAPAANPVEIIDINPGGLTMVETPSLTRTHALHDYKAFLANLAHSVRELRRAGQDPAALVTLFGEAMAWFQANSQAPEPAIRERLLALDLREALARFKMQRH